MSTYGFPTDPTAIHWRTRQPLRASGPSRSGSLFLACAGVVAVADFLFYGHVVGWTAGAFLLLALAVILARPAVGGAAGPRRIAAAVVALLAIALAQEPNVLCILVGASGLTAVAMIGRDGWTASLAEWSFRAWCWASTAWMRPGRDAATAARGLVRDPAATCGPLRGIAVWTVPLLLSAGFLALFSLANPIVEGWCAALTARLALVPDLLDGLLRVDRVVFWVATFVWMWAMLRCRSKRRRAAAATAPAAVTLYPAPGPGLVVRCLAAFNAVFAVETALDALYLWGGRALPAGLTYKQYAHRGAYPLIATALLAAAFVLLTFRAGSGTARWRWARRLVYLWIAQNVALTISAAWRLWLYIESSNLTRLRLATAVWLALVAFGLVTIVWRILAGHDNAWLLRVNVAAAVGVLYACCFLNLDGFIATFNAQRCDEISLDGRPVGLTYLRDLGPDALPALTSLSRRLPRADSRAVAAKYARQLQDQLAAELSDWRGWTWRRHRLSHP